MQEATRIVRSCELAESIWMQASDLGNALTAMTEVAFKQQPFPNLQAAGTSHQSYQHSASGWSYMGYAIAFPVMKKKRRKLAPEAWISYQISVFGSGIPPVQGDGQESVGPVIHVSFWHARTDFEDTAMHVAFPPEWGDWQIKHERLLSWESETIDHFPQWTFSLRLLALNSEDDLKTSIIEPVRALLEGKEANIALPANLPGLIFYAEEDQGADVWHLVSTNAP